MSKTQVGGNQILDATITDADVAAANKDGAAGTPSMRTLGTGAQQAMQGSLAAPLASPTFTGTPSGPTAALSTNTTQFATTAYVMAQINNDAILALGKAGGQILIGGTGSAENLTLNSTSHATKGNIYLGSSAGVVYDEVNNRLGVRTAPSYALDVNAGNTTDIYTAQTTRIYTGVDAGTRAAHYVSSIYNPGSAPSVNQNAASLYVHSETLAACSQNFAGALFGSFYEAQHKGTGTLSVLTGLQINTQQDAGTGVVATHRGIFVNTAVAATSSNVFSITVQPTINNAAGRVTNWYSSRVLAPSITAGGLITSCFGGQIDNMGSSAVTIAYGLAIANQSGAAANVNLMLGGTSLPTGSWSLYSLSTNPSYVNGTLLFGTTTLPTSATFNICLGGGTTSPILGAATADIVSLAAVDKAAGDRRLYIQSESGSAISIGNDRLNFAAASGLISIGGTDAITITTTTLTAPQFTSTVTTGTVPLVVASTTKVANLNADLLDGLDSTAFALLASPTFTGVPAAPTAAPGTNTTQIATTAFVKAGIDVVLGGVSAAFDTLSEIATELALKAYIASPTFTGIVTSPQFTSTVATGTAPLSVASTTKVANLNVDLLDDLDSTAFVLLAGLAGGQTIKGDTAASGWLRLQSTSHATRGQVEVSDGFSLAQSETPTTLTGVEQNNYNIGVGTAVVRLNASADTVIDSIANPTTGKILVLHNISNFTITLLHQNLTSIAVNRIICPGVAGYNYTLNPNEAVMLRYDGVNARWRVVGSNAVRVNDGIVGGQSIVGGVANHEYINLLGSTGTLLGGIVLGDGVLFQGVISPAQITSDQNDYTTGKDNTFAYRLNSDNSTRKITGISTAAAAGPNGKTVAIINVGTSDITLVHESASSTAGYRFNFVGSTNQVVRPNGCCLLYYDNNSSRWRAIADAQRLPIVDTRPAASLTIPANNVMLSFGLPYQIAAGVIVSIAAGAILRITP